MNYSLQNMRDRYYGNNDPVAEKILNRAKVRIAINGPSSVMSVPQDTTNR